MAWTVRPFFLQSNRICQRSLVSGPALAAGQRVTRLTLLDSLVQGRTCHASAGR